MIITDLNGTPIELTDLDKALAQADSFRGYKHTDNTHKALDKRLKAYWQDLYIKLKQLKEAQTQPLIKPNSLWKAFT